MSACEFGELNIVRELLEAGVDPNAVDNVSYQAKSQSSNFLCWIKNFPNP